MHIQLKALLVWPHQLSEYTLLESPLCHAPPPAAHSLHEVLWPAAQNPLSSPYLRISLPPWPRWSVSCSESSPSPLYLVDFSCPGGKGRAGQGRRIHVVFMHMCAHACGNQRPIQSAFLNHSALCFWRQGLSLNRELTSSATFVPWARTSGHTTAVDFFLFLLLLVIKLGFSCLLHRHFRQVLPFRPTFPVLTLWH